MLLLLSILCSWYLHWVGYIYWELDNNFRFSKYSFFIYCLLRYLYEFGGFICIYNYYRLIKSVCICVGVCFCLLVGWVRLCVLCVICVVKVCIIFFFGLTLNCLIAFWFLNFCMTIISFLSKIVAFLLNFSFFFCLIFSWLTYHLVEGVSSYFFHSIIFFSKRHRS